MIDVKIEFIQFDRKVSGLQCFTSQNILSCFALFAVLKLFTNFAWFTLQEPFEEISRHTHYIYPELTNSISPNTISAQVYKNTHRLRAKKHC